jgi:hypothetical protein
MGFDLFSIGDNNPLSPTFATANLQNAIAGENAAAQAKITGANLANANDQQIYSDTVNKFSPYTQSGTDALNQMRMMMGMAPISASTSGAPNKPATLGPANPVVVPGLGHSSPNTPGLGAGDNSAPGHRAMGGPTYPGQSYVVGEHGPEMLHMAPGSQGYVDPNPNTKAMMASGRYPGRAMGGPVVGSGGREVNQVVGAVKGMYPGTGLPAQNGAVNTAPVAPAQKQLTQQQILQDNPGYKFQLKQGENAVLGGNLAAGRGLSGAQVKGAEGYATGLASQDWNNIFNQNATIAGMGESAVGTEGEIGMYTGMNEGNNYLVGSGAQAQGDMGGYNMATGVLGNASSLIGGLFGGGGK